MLEKLIVLVEEYSMEAALEHLLPKMLANAEFEIRRFQCKDDLLKRLPERLAAYSEWLPDNYVILVLVDRDDDDCLELKAQLESIATNSGLETKTTMSAGGRFHVINRIVIEELEAWFFGDWNAVMSAFPRVPTTIPQKAGFRDPDSILGGTWEALERIVQRAGYFKTGLRKLDCARAIAVHMEPSRNTSTSFQALRDALTAAEA